MMNRFALARTAAALAALTLLPIRDAAAQQAPSAAEQQQMMRDLNREMDTLEALRRKPGVGPKELFTLIDENGDGRIDRTEWRLRNMRLLAIRDADGDARLSPEEVPGIGVDAFGAADSNGDGFLSGLELNQAEFMRFEAIDPNDTGAVDFETFLAFVQTLR